MYLVYAHYAIQPHNPVQIHHAHEMAYKLWMDNRSDIDPEVDDIVLIGLRCMMLNGDDTSNRAVCIACFCNPL